MKFSSYINSLLAARLGQELRQPSDCERLVLDIESVTGEHIGLNTMKRLLGFIADERTPRTSTLDIVARYLGYDRWEALRLSDEQQSNSAFDDQPGSELLADDLDVGQRVLVGYQPNRLLTLRYQGQHRFIVEQSQHSKLQAGDQIVLTHLVSGYPLLVAQVLRQGSDLGPFTAGRAQGIHYQLL
ncbi:MAG: hypothetical protein IJ841_10165 [Prevotella sp.]|nr:hypothetical protein [Prevotella sp.]